MSESDPLFQVEKFKDYRPKDQLNHFSADYEVRVKWEGYDKPGDDTWEPLINMFEDEGTHNYVVEFFLAVGLRPVTNGKNQIKMVKLNGEGE
jgi:hypothetical protein